MTRLLYFTLLLLVGQLCFAQDFDGFVLYNSQNQNTTYLIDKNGDIAHTWSLNRPCNYAVLMMDSGNIMRGAVKSGNAINGPAVGGLVQEFDPQGELVWEFEYSSNIYVMHHDITLMPNGNVLLTAWEVKNSAELQALGYTGNGNEKYPTHFIEVSQIDGTTDGEIVWEWHMIDHLVQDVDETKPSYGVISENPQLMDINVPVQGGGGPGGGGGDWFHVNGVDYNEDLDIITFSSRYLSEVFIFDHSTTSEEAASHEGGNFGMGGDLLYRWGNPENYEMAPDQKIYGPVHDARFITDDGRPRGGFLQFFNNEGVGNGSIVNAIELPYNDDKNGFLRDAGSAFGPADAAFTHECFSNADGQSASNSMSNGNVFVNLSKGYIYEADLDDNVVFQYNDGPPKSFRYECSHPGIQKLITEGVIDNTCSMVNNLDEELAQLQVSPNPSSGIFTLDGLEDLQQAVTITVTDLTGKIIWTGNSAQIDLQNQM